MRVVLLVLVVYAVLGAVAGVVWEWLWTPPVRLVEQHQLLYDSYASLRRVFTGTGWYALVGAVASAVLALAVCVLARARELVVLAAVVVGSIVAAFVMMKVGTALGPNATPARVVAHAANGTVVHDPLTVAGTSVWGVKSAYLVWPMTSLFVLALTYFAWPVSFAPHHRAHADAPDPREADPTAATGG